MCSTLVKERASGTIQNEYQLPGVVGTKLIIEQTCFIDTPGNSFLFSVSGFEKGWHSDDPFWVNCSALLGRLPNAPNEAVQLLRVYKQY